MKKNITISLEKAREWYNSGDESLKEITLQAFSEEELQVDFKVITSLYEACNALNLDSNTVECQSFEIAKISRASAAMFQLNIVRKALNLGQDLSLTENPKYYLYYPYNPFVTKSSTYYKNELNSGEMEVIGKIKSKGETYNVIGNCADFSHGNGLGSFDPSVDMGYSIIAIGFLGCASKEIAKHFGKYFGMLITEAKYGDLVDFEVIENKYQ